MGIFKTPEEKAAIQADRDRQAVEQEAQRAERARREAAHAAPLPKWEYLVVDVGAGDGSKPGTLEAKLDGAAASGWRAISVVPLQINASGSYVEQVLRVVFERPAPDSGHLGHAIQPIPASAPSPR